MSLYTKIHQVKENTTQFIAIFLENFIHNRTTFVLFKVCYNFEMNYEIFFDLNKICFLRTA